MSWFQRRTEKPDGMYNASSSEYACFSCAYREGSLCHLHKRDLDLFLLTQKKCADFLRKDSSIPEIEP